MLKQSKLNHKISRRYALTGVTGLAVLIASFERKTLAPNFKDDCSDKTLRMKNDNLIRIQALAKTITHSATSPIEAAVLIHRWVRDEIAFGIPAQFYDMTASEVLDAKIGFCNTKTTLFSALLAAYGIATRLRMIDLSARVLNGLFDPGTPFVDHAITEVQLADQWYSVDSYVVDYALANQARARLDASGAEVGFGIHRMGSSEWDGASDSLIQAFDDGRNTGYINKQHGYFNDIADFYARTANARNRRTFTTGLIVRLIAASTNRAIDRVRRGG